MAPLVQAENPNTEEIRKRKQNKTKQKKKIGAPVKVLKVAGRLSLRPAWRVVFLRSQRS